jgi:hypothetical protein
MHDKRGGEPSRNVWQAIGKGLRGRCPACDEGRIFRAYLKVNNICPHCGEELFHHRADDAPPYLARCAALAACDDLAYSGAHALALAPADSQRRPHRLPMGLAHARF